LRLAPGARELGEDVVNADLVPARLIGAVAVIVVSDLLQRGLVLSDSVEADALEQLCVGVVGALLTRAKGGTV